MSVLLALLALLALPALPAQGLFLGRGSERTCSLSIIESMVMMMARNKQLLKQEPREDRVRDKAEFDFIIVGAGTAGCVLANRLTEVGEWKVLLLEAGRSENYIMDIPLVASYIQFSEANWKYQTEPNLQACLGMEDHRCNYPRGKALGGCSVLNFMIHTRGNRRDYDNWEALGNAGWGYDSVLPYFKKSEAVQDPAMDSRYRGARGPHSVCFPGYRTPLAEAFVSAGPATGSRIVKDYNGPTQTGFSFLQVSMHNGTRQSEARAYLSPIRDRKNLFIRKQALVTRVLIHPHTGRAYGVRYTGPGRRNYTAYAAMEVIVSAGAINSPQLLMLSGLGERRELEAVGVPVLRDLPGVGLNLQDHVALGGLTFLVNQSVSLLSERLYEDPQFFSEYFSYHRGPATIPGGCEALAFYDLQRPHDEDGYPDLELLFQGGSLVSDPALRRTFNIDPALFAAVYEPIRSNDSWMVFPMGLRPLSRGRVTLRSRDPTQPPAIHPNYFQHPQDLDVIVTGVHKAIQVAQSEPFRRFGTRLHDAPIPECAAYGFGSDAYWSCAARHLTFTIYHQCGTCKMGPPSDPEAVVDPRLRVRGVTGLRVVDASVIPVIPAAHTNAPVLMIAEKAADMIKEDWASPHHAHWHGNWHREGEGEGP